MKKLLITFCLIAIVTLSVFGFSACDNNDVDKTIKIGASVTPHAEILEVVKEILAEDGWNLVIVEFTEYILPNKALHSGEIDANFFQHVPFMNDFNENNNADLVSAMAVHYEPFGIYAGKTKSLKEINENSTVAIPDDPTNCARALLLLEEQGLVTLDSDELTITRENIVDDKSILKKKNITEIKANLVSSSIKEKDIVILNGNYAQLAGLKVADALAIEYVDGVAARAYANVIAVNKNDLNSEKTVALINAIKTKVVKDFIKENFADGSVVPVFSL